MERLSKDSVDYIRQIAFISLAMVLVNQGKDNEKVEALRKTLDERVKVSTGVRVGTGWSVMGGVRGGYPDCVPAANKRCKGAHQPCLARGGTNPVCGVWSGVCVRVSTG